jgi:Flp pilus assembly pilin Flp
MSPTKLQARLARLGAEETGQTLIEYAGMALLISIVVIVVLTAVGLDLAEMMDEIENTLGLGADNTMDTTPGTDDQAAPTGVVS